MTFSLLHEGDGFLALPRFHGFKCAQNFLLTQFVPGDTRFLAHLRTMFFE